MLLTARDIFFVVFLLFFLGVGGGSVNLVH